MATGSGWGEVIGSIISLLGSTIISKIDESTLNYYKRVAKSTGASYSDVISLINGLSTWVGGQSSSTITNLVNKISNIISNFGYSSGLAESKLSAVRNKLMKIQNQANKLQASGQAKETQATNLLNAYGSYTDEEKSKAKEWNVRKDGKKVKTLNKGEAQIWNSILNSSDENVKKLRDQIDSSNTTVTNDWTSTEAGQTGQRAEELAKSAANDYAESNKLGEKYV